MTCFGQNNTGRNNTDLFVPLKRSAVDVMTVPEPFMTVPEPCPYGVEVEAMKFHEATLVAQLSISSCNYKKTIVFDKSKQPNFRLALADSDDFF